MRSISPRARWATLALALSIAMPTQLALAEHKAAAPSGGTAAPSGGTAAAKKKVRRSIAECTSFDQRDRDEEDGVDFAVTNSCTVPVACAVHWAVTCAPESRKRRSRKVGSSTFQLDASNGITVTASAARCGDDSWSVDGISWSCDPSTD